MKIILKTPRYGEAKSIVDAHVLAGEYEWTRQDVPGFPIDPFEMGRVLMALYLAANFKKFTAKTFIDRFSKTAFQTYLDVASGNNNDRYLHIKEGLGLKNLKDVYISNHDYPAVNGKGIPDILGNLIEDEMTDRDVGDDPSAFAAFRNKMHFALSVARMSGLDTTGLDAEKICGQAEKQRGHRNGAAHYHYGFVLPGSNAILQGTCSPYAGEKATSELQSEIASILQNRNEIAELDAHLTAAFADYDPDLKPDLHYRYRNLTHMGPDVQVVLVVRGFGDDLVERWTRRGIGHHRLSGSPILEQDLTSCEPHSGPAPVLHELRRTLRLEERRRKIALKAKRAIGPGNIMIDPVTECVLAMLEPHLEGLRRDVLAGNVEKVMPKLELMRTVSGGTNVKGKPERMSRTLPVVFRLKNGRLRCRVPLDKNTTWSRDRLVTRQLPETVRQALIGKPATAIVEHPFTAMLGAVTAARLRNGKTEILFDVPERAISAPATEPSEQQPN